MTISSILPKGISFARAGLAMLNTTDMQRAAGYGATRWGCDTATATILRGAIAAGSVSGIGPGDWGGELAFAQAGSVELIEAVIAQTCFLKLPVRACPYDVHIAQVAQTSQSVWSGEGQAKGCTAESFANLPMIRRGKKVAAIVVVTNELARSQTPEAEKLFLNDLTAGLSLAIDRAAFSADAATDTRPAGLAYGAPTVATGSDLLAAIASAFAAFRGDPLRAAFIAAPSTIIALATMRSGAAGPLLFPTIAMRAGSLMGLPLYPSAGVPPGQLLLTDPGLILTASDPQDISLSKEASVEMDSAPDDPTAAGTVLVSLWQNNLAGLRAELMIDWQSPVTGSTVVITGLAAVTSKAPAK